MLRAPDINDIHAPGAQVPRPTTGTTAPTRVLAAAAYRPGPYGPFAALRGNSWKPGKLALFQPDFGEAFTRSVLRRMLGDGRVHRKPLVPSYATDARMVTEYCLEAKAERRGRDRRLTGLMLLFGLPFLPGTLIWLFIFQVRRIVERFGRSRDRAIAWVLTAILAFLGFYLLLWNPPFHNEAVRWYCRSLMVGPVLGWWIARGYCIRTSVAFKDKCLALMAGKASGPRLELAVPQGPGDKKREERRLALTKIVEEQETNLLFYAGKRGIHGLGPRWGIWNLAEELTPQPGAGIEPFRAWDLVRVIRGRLEQLQQQPLNTGGFTKPKVDDWVISAMGAGGKRLKPWYEAQWKPGKQAPDERMDGYRARQSVVSDICNRTHFDAGPRHYLSVQFPIWGGQLLLTLMVTVTVLHTTLRVEVTGHVLGPIDGALSDEPEPEPSVRAANGWRFWEQEDIELPFPKVDADEVVRLCVRAPFFKAPRVLDWLGGKVVFAEPFGLRTAWTGKPWGNRFMADDAVRAVAPVVRAVHNATLQFLDQRGVDTSRFATRSLGLQASTQTVAPAKPDEADGPEPP
ncbi:hypothetical protein BIV57_17580 [Mangrovactinospora gilvigrisea]|uniref:Uncharacterized protein n=1 Tax=Mangrovactinospora gilvigrisea TaxID=1428644 RepID=A0A1J7BBX0_9ACTN|nr:hypothetical protein BIV57_17580 [Mangrovactinospora gilvigrisea]